MRLPIVRNCWRRDGKTTSCWQQDIKRGEYAVGILKALAVTAVTAWLFYRSLWALIPLSPVFIWYYRMWRSECIRKKEREFQAQFKEAVQALSSSLSTGYSLENAWKEAEKEIRLLYNQEARIRKELRIVVAQIRVNVPMEQILCEWADRVPIEDVRNFTAVFAAAKRSGGDLVAIIRNTVSQMGDKMEVKREIDTLLAAKEYEFKVMTAVPYVMIGYMVLSFPEFAESLYGTVLGVGVMTGCLIIYIGSFYFGKKIINIQV